MTRFAFTVSAQAHYDAAHFLKNYDGKCRQLHGHRYVVEAAVQSTELDDSGIAFDFVDLKGALRGVAFFFFGDAVGLSPPILERAGGM